MLRAVVVRAEIETWAPVQVAVFPLAKDRLAKQREQSFEVS